MKKIVLLLILSTLVLPLHLSAQARHTLHGEITSVDGSPIPGVAVTIKGNASLWAESAADGAFKFKLSNGKYTLVASLVGYQTVEKEFELTGDSVIKIQLAEQAENLDAVMVVGKSSAQLLKETALAVSALNIRPIINSAHNLNTIVNKTTGVKVRESGGVGSDFELSINGMSGNSVRYFIDGVPMAAKGSGVNLSNIPLNIIERIEIYKGVVPSHLGADALGGAINIITKQDRKNYLDFSYGYGSFNTHKSDFSAQYVSKNGLIFKPVIGVNFSENNYKVKDVEVWSEEKGKYVLEERRRFHDDYLSMLGQLEAGVSGKKWADAFFVSASYSKVDKQLQTGSIQSIVYGEAERESDSKNISATYRKKDFVFDKLHFNALLSYTWDHSRTIDTAFRKYDWDRKYIATTRNEISGDSRSIRNYKRPRAVARANFDYAISGKHSFNLNYLLNRLGNERYDEVDNTFSKSNDVLANHILGLSYNQTLFGGKMSNVFFVKDYINYLMVNQRDESWVSGSDRVDKKATKDYWGYGAALRYTLMEELALKVSYEHSVRLPLGNELLGNGITVLPNLTLKPESSENYNLGFFGSAKASNGHLFNYEANAFVRDASDYVRLVISERDGLSQYENVTSVKVQGVEGEFSYNYSDMLRFMANCSWQDAKDMNRFKEDGKASITYKNKLPNRPWLFGNAELDFYFRDILHRGDKLRVGYHYQYVHWFYLTWEAYGSLDGKSKIPTQHQHNAVVSYSWRSERYNLSLECNNLLDKALYDNFMLQKPGRSFFLKFRLFIN
ncbi:MAG: TonB-dependent receptor plug domain-containing protein [Bacteroidales bacterium]|nr:TonB-dependent receptor plug domain-containing protein [Bacteroidales bacterium]